MSTFLKFLVMYVTVLVACPRQDSKSPYCDIQTIYRTVVQQPTYLHCTCMYAVYNNYTAAMMIIQSQHLLAISVRTIITQRVQHTLDTYRQFNSVMNKHTNYLTLPYHKTSYWTVVILLHPALYMPSVWPGGPFLCYMRLTTTHHQRMCTKASALCKELYRQQLPLISHTLLLWTHSWSCNVLTL